MLMGCGLTLVVVTGCGGTRDAERPPVAGTNVSLVSQRYVGCIGPTADPQQFILSALEGRDFTTGEPPGTPIPRKSELPEGAPPPLPPITVTTGTPGGGPTPTTKVVTYRLVGDGGINLLNHVGHTVEVLGTQEPASANGAASNDVTPPLYVTSVRVLADHCQ